MIVDPSLTYRNHYKSSVWQTEADTVTTLGTDAGMSPCQRKPSSKTVSLRIICFLFNPQVYQAMIIEDRGLIRRDKEMEKYFREQRAMRFREWGIISLEGNEFDIDGNAIVSVVGDMEEGGEEVEEQEVWDM